MNKTKMYWKDVHLNIGLMNGTSHVDKLVVVHLVAVHWSKKTDSLF